MSNASNASVILMDVRSRMSRHSVPSHQAVANSAGKLLAGPLLLAENFNPAPSPQPQAPQPSAWKAMASNGFARNSRSGGADWAGMPMAAPLLAPVVSYAWPARGSREKPASTQPLVHERASSGSREALKGWLAHKFEGMGCSCN